MTTTVSVSHVLLVDPCVGFVENLKQYAAGDAALTKKIFEAMGHGYDRYEPYVEREPRAEPNPLIEEARRFIVEMRRVTKRVGRAARRHAVRRGYR